MKELLIILKIKLGHNVGGSNSVIFELIILNNLGFKGYVFLSSASFNEQISLESFCITMIKLI